MGEMTELTDIDWRVIRARFAMSIAKMMICDAYWDVAANRVRFRGVTAQRRFALPQTALYFGRYEFPFPAKTFERDLNDFIDYLHSPGWGCRENAIGRAGDRRRV